MTRRIGRAGRTSADRYLALTTLRTFILVASALTGLFSLLEFVEQLASVGEGHYHVVDALLFVLLTAPSRLLQVAPVSMLLGCLLALGTLARNSELTAMLSLGISEFRIVNAVLWLSVPISIVLLLMMEFVIPPAQQLAREQRASALSFSSHGGGENGFWAERNREYLDIAHFERGDVPVGIDIYRFRPDGTLDTVLHAERATIEPGGAWLLRNVSRKQVGVASVQTEHLATLSWSSFISPRQIQFLILPPDSVPPFALLRHIRGLPHDQKSIRLRQELWTKASLPLSLVAMIIVAAPFVFGSPRMQSNGQNLALGVGFGIVFSLGQQIVARLGLLLELSPALTALVPPLLVIAMAILVFRRARRPQARRPVAIRPVPAD